MPQIREARPFGAVQQHVPQGRWPMPVPARMTSGPRMRSPTSELGPLMLGMQQLAGNRATARHKESIDSMSEMGEMESLRLQMAMDRHSKLMSTISNMIKKSSETSQGITQNLK